MVWGRLSGYIRMTLQVMLEKPVTGEREVLSGRGDEAGEYPHRPFRDGRLLSRRS